MEPVECLGQAELRAEGVGQAAHVIADLQHVVWLPKG